MNKQKSSKIVRNLRAELDATKHADCVNEAEIFYLGWRNGVAVVFETFEAAGYVGETITSTSAWLMHSRSQSKRRTLFPLTYADVKDLYRYVQSRYFRMKYWRYMRAMSPEGEAEALERATAQIKSFCAGKE